MGIGMLIFTGILGVVALVIGLVTINRTKVKDPENVRGLGALMIVVGIVFLVIVAGYGIDHLAQTTYRIAKEASDQYYLDLAKELKAQTGVEFSYWNRELVGTYEYKFTVKSLWDKSLGDHFLEVRISQVKHYTDEQVGPDIMYSAKDVDELSKIIKKFAKVGETYASDQVN